MPECMPTTARKSVLIDDELLGRTLTRMLRAYQKAIVFLPTGTASHTLSTFLSRCPNRRFAIEQLTARPNPS